MEGTIGRPGKKANRLLDIFCPVCGAAANYDIRTGAYACAYCGGRVGIREAVAQKRGFRVLHQKKMQASLGALSFKKASCSKCGAEVILWENEALAHCDFCGSTLVRGRYLDSGEMPELVIPFVLTEEEARKRLLDFCKSGGLGRKEKMALSGKEAALRGYYLPYELIRGPVDCRAFRMDGGRTYSLGGYVEEVFVNCSRQLDNLLLDGMEPFDLSELAEFDFAYVAGHRVKVGDISGKELEARVEKEVGESYAPTVQKTMETKAVQVRADVSGVLRMPVLLPVYYLCDGELMAAVNGQTGKVSVRALRPTRRTFLPWWLKAFLATFLLSGLSFGAFLLFGMSLVESLGVSALLALFFLIVTLVAFSDTPHLKFHVEVGRKVFTSSGGPFRRRGRGAIKNPGSALLPDGELFQDPDPIPRREVVPVFFENLDGERVAVRLRFTTPLRMLWMIALALLVLFLPVVIALFLNGFNFARLNLAGSAVWFCIFVPVVPIYLLKFGRMELYDHPWVYRIDEDGKERRVRKRRAGKVDIGETALMILHLLIVPPLCLAVWFAILSFAVMCYLTAFG